MGNFVVAWESDGQDGSGYGVFAQRFGGLGPAALTVDNFGNQVLEPGETVDVRPSWRNFNGAAQTFSGTLTTITGPAGATYTITDGAGNYGTVANGATAPCTDCYAVALSNPPTRPALHWDAAAVESIVPDTLGQQKQWRLHVGASFTDVPTANPFYRFIETLLHHQITGGCGGTNYCPANSTSRRADGRLRAGREGRSRLRSARLRHAHVRRRAGQQPVLPVHRRAGASWRGHRVRRRQLLPDESGHA